MVGGLMFLVVSSFTVLLVGQYRAAISGAELAVQANERMVIVVRLRELLASIDWSARSGIIEEPRVGDFSRLVSELKVKARGEKVAAAIGRLEHGFGEYLSELRKFGHRAYSSHDAHVRFQAVYILMNVLVEEVGGVVNSAAVNLESHHKRSVYLAIAVMILSIVLIAMIGIKFIAVTILPLSALTRFLDEIRIEDDLPGSLPHFGSDVPELSMLSRSFERLLERLRGYRALNVRRLLTEKRRADIIAASITDGVLLLRGEEILYSNPVAERIMDLASAPVVPGMRLSEIKASAVMAIRTAMERTMPVEFVLEFDGGKNYYLIQAFPVSYDLIEQVEHSMGYENGRLLERFHADILVLAQDITIVRESQEAKSHFLATLSHEIKTPVTSLTLATRLLRKSIAEFENSTHRALIETCATDVDRLRILLEDLLTISRFDTLTQKMEIQVVDLGKLLRNTVQSFQVQCRDRGIEITSNIARAGKSHLVPLDPTKVSWAISNLLTNAVRHTPPGGKIDVEMEVVDDYAEVRVRDSGSGIDQKRQARIFDKFSQHYDIRVARSGSAGVGLAISREIIAAHGGTIWVTSEPGVGALFGFRLPLKGVEKVDDSIAMKGATIGTPARS